MEPGPALRAAARLCLALLLLGLAQSLRAELDVADYEIGKALKDEGQRRRAADEIAAERQRQEARAAAEAARREAEAAARQAAWLALPAEERLLRTRCVSCHSLGPVEPVRHTLPGWLAVTLRMKYANGAPLDAGELWQISCYLARRQPATGLDAALEWAALFLPLALCLPLWRRYRRGKAAHQGADI